MSNDRLFNNPRFRFLCEKIHAPGPRIFAELLSEFADEIGRERLMARMETYGTMATVAGKLGAGEMPAHAVFEVPSARAED
jgi:hypothetical protein